MAKDPANLRRVATVLDGRRLLYRTGATPPPEGARTIVHVHGFAISGTYLLPTASLLAPKYRTFVPDLPGFGKSQHPKRALTIRQLADSVARFMDIVGVERAVILGNSLGAPVAGAFLHQHADRVDSVILCSPAGGNHNRPIYKAVAQMAVAGIREPMGMLPIAVNDYAHYGILPSIRLLESMISYPMLQRVAELRVPTLVVLGSRDPLVSESNVRAQARRLPHVTVVTIEGAAHAMNFSHPEQLAGIVDAFLENRPIVGVTGAKGGVRVVHVPSA
jgi:pimeloyl-ACP methyl ester carboxylesterase